MRGWVMVQWKGFVFSPKPSAAGATGRQGGLDGTVWDSDVQRRANGVSAQCGTAWQMGADQPTTSCWKQGLQTWGKAASKMVGFGGWRKVRDWYH